MAVFSSNQVRHLYVANAYNETVDESASVGTIGSLKEIEDGLCKQIMFLYKGANTVLASDLIQVKNIGYVKAIAASDMVIPMKKVKVSLKSDVNGGNPISGQDYILGINFKNFFSSGDASQYYKDAAVHATANMTAEDFYTAMKDALNMAFSREDGASKASNPYLTFTSDSEGLYIEEKPQDWALGVKKARRIMFDVFCSTVYTTGDDLIWGTVEDQTPKKEEVTVGTNGIGNGQQIADMEWFYMGERGDQYRGVGYPNIIPTTYLVDPSKEYNVLEIHYAFTDTGVNSYRTEKELTVVSTDKEVINSLISAINSAAGLEIATLD